MNQWKLEDNLNEEYSNLKYSRSGSEYYNLLIDCTKENKLLKDKIEKLQNDYKQNLIKQLLDKKQEEDFLNIAERNYLDLKKQYAQQAAKLEELEDEFKELQRSYHSIRNSKLGRITIKYWELRKSIRKRVGR